MQTQFSMGGKHTVASRLLTLRVNDHVYVYDGKKQSNVWQEIAAIKEVDGRLKIRVKGTGFFFDEALVISFALDHHFDCVRASGTANTLEHVTLSLHEARLRTLIALAQMSCGARLYLVALLGALDLACAELNHEQEVGA